MLPTDRCLHGMDPQYCAICNHVVRAIEQKHIPVPRATFAQRKMLKAADQKSAGVPLNWSLPEQVDEFNDPDKTYCTFCGSQVEQINLTTGQSKPKIRISDDLYRDPDTDKITSHRRVSVTTEILNACPDCSLKIRRPVVVQRV